MHQGDHSIITIRSYRKNNQLPISFPTHRSIWKAPLSRYVSGRPYGTVVVSVEFSTNLRIENKCLLLKCANHSGWGVRHSPCGFWSERLSNSTTTTEVGESEPNIMDYIYENERNPSGQSNTTHKKTTENSADEDQDNYVPMAPNIVVQPQVITTIVDENPKGEIIQSRQTSKPNSGLVEWIPFNKNLVFYFSSRWKR